MNALYILGSIGGILVIIEELISFAKGLKRIIKEIRKYERFYRKHHSDNDNTKVPMGFRTEKEQAEIEAMMARKG